MALGPRSRGSYHRPRGPSAMPQRAPQLKRYKTSMVGLLVLGIAAVWLFVAAWIARRASNWFPLRTASGVVGSIAFVCAAALHFADEVIGRWQFQRLCASEAVVWVHPNAAKVIAARDASRSQDLVGFVFPIQEQVSEYVDSVTGEPFLRVKAFHTPGGFIMRAGLNMGSSTACWPERWTEPYRTLRLDELLKRGKT